MDLEGAEEEAIVDEVGVLEEVEDGGGSDLEAWPVRRRPVFAPIVEMFPPIGGGNLVFKRDALVAGRL